MSDARISKPQPPEPPETAAGGPGAEVDVATYFPEPPVDPQPPEPGD
ncbi:hypothetical protein [Actinorugispora endophytica]|uniref:Uncharacterized protein n=1 Tax=Actinorugispora endophytica TaxID=1605990 RepID=A0A4R6UXN7_9ACTN|nr:hypothetical protein [Actinorugispora endophytica]TDQ50779.1 hypothetical protein EV190_11284 [Actinorugispora endophytica]